jgi:hypothetical protein
MEPADASCVQADPHALQGFPMAAGVQRGFYIGLLVAAPAFPTQAQEADYLQRFDGSWSGGGTVQRRADEGPLKVSCQLTGSSSSNALSISGTCRAAVIFTRQIGVDVTVDGSGRYRGTYTGSTIGPAALSGRRNGDTVTFTITWPKPVFGDTEGTMSVTNGGQGNLGIVMNDNLAPGAAPTRITDLQLSRR